MGRKGDTAGSMEQGRPPPPPHPLPPRRPLVVHSKIGGTAATGTARQRRPMLNRHAPWRTSVLCLCGGGGRGVRCCCQLRHGVRGAWPAVQSAAAQPAQGGGLLGPGFTLWVQPHGGRSNIHCAFGRRCGGPQSGAWALLQRGHVVGRPRSFRHAAIYWVGRV